jgi:hypothetical protein
MPNFIPSPTTRDLTKEQLRKLIELIKEYLRNLNKPGICNGCCDAEIDFFSKLDFAQAIQQAALAKNHEGKKFPHQYRITTNSLNKSFDILSANNNELQQCDDFDTLLNLIRKLLEVVHGVDDLYYYDTSFRIGLSLGFKPQRVYLHAGTKEGAKALFNNLRGIASLDMDSLPKPLRELAPYQVEDFLCRYKTNLHEMMDN